MGILKSEIGRTVIGLSVIAMAIYFTIIMPGNKAIERVEETERMEAIKEATSKTIRNINTKDANRTQGEIDEIESESEDIYYTSDFIDF